jgi:hypothetical protein
MLELNNLIVSDNYLRVFILKINLIHYFNILLLKL